jgi:hypothetical protein
VGSLCAPHCCSGSLRASTLGTAKTIQTEVLLLFIGPTHAEPKVIGPCPTKLGTDSVMYSWAAGSGTFLTPPVILTGSSEPQPLAPAGRATEPQSSSHFPPEDVSSWEASSAGLTFLLLDGQAVSSFLGPSWKPLRADRYFLSAIGLNKCALRCQRRSTLRLLTSTATHCRSLGGSAVTPPLAPSGSITELQPSRQFLWEEHSSAGPRLH